MKDNNYPLEDLDRIHKDVIQAAYDIIEKKKATYYGIGMSLNRLVRAILDDENSILTVSTYLDNKYNQNGLFIGVPAVINSKGVRELMEIKLDETEQMKLDNSCNLIKEIIKNSIDQLL